MQYDLHSMGSRWIIEFDAIDSSNPEGSAWKVGIAPALLDVLRTNSHTVKLMRIMLVKEVLIGPCAIFGGWSRPEKDDCFVYAGRPNRDYRGKQIETPPPPGMIFLVFVLPDGTIDDWSWRRVLEDDPGLPQGISGRMLWPQT